MTVAQEVADAGTGFGSDDRVSIFPRIIRDSVGRVLPSKCSLNVQVIPDQGNPNGYRVVAEALYHTSSERL